MTYLFIFYQHIESIITQLWILHNIKLLLLSSSRFYVGISLYFEFLFYLRFYSPPTFVVFTWWLLPWILKNTLHGFFSTRKENIHDLWLVFLNYAATPLVMLIFEIWMRIVFSSIAGSLIWTSCLTSLVFDVSNWCMEDIGTPFALSSNQAPYTIATLKSWKLPPDRSIFIQHMWTSVVKQ